mmetsp:Transcript_8042/g.18686  ORF Transcript_8042/g.18686 Transcript_8042/m.18686 type:complete len:349 (-) Transcript_8042:37-1083(-)
MSTVPMYVSRHSHRHSSTLSFLMYISTNSPESESRARCFVGQEVISEVMSFEVEWGLLGMAASLIFPVEGLTAAPPILEVRHVGVGCVIGRFVVVRVPHVWLVVVACADTGVVVNARLNRIGLIPHKWQLWALDRVPRRNRSCQRAPLPVVVLLFLVVIVPYAFRDGVVLPLVRCEGGCRVCLAPGGARVAPRVVVPVIVRFTPQRLWMIVLDPCRDLVDPLNRVVHEGGGRICLAPEGAPVAPSVVIAVLVCGLVGLLDVVVPDGTRNDVLLGFPILVPRNLASSSVRELELPLLGRQLQRSPLSLVETQGDRAEESCSRQQHGSTRRFAHPAHPFLLLFCTASSGR